MANIISEFQNSIKGTEQSLSRKEEEQAKVVSAQFSSILNINMRLKISAQCRICLEGEDEGRLIKPCACLGTVCFVHQKCLAEWIRRKQQENRKMKVFCQMCGYPFRYRTVTTKRLSCDDLINNYEKQKRSYRSFLFGAIVFLMAIIWIVFVLVAESCQTRFAKAVKTELIRSENSKIVWICVLFILVIFLFFMILLFVLEYGVISELRIVEIGSISQGNGRRIYPANL